MRRCHLGPLSVCLGDGIFWVRFFGYGLWATRRPPLFSERNGYRVPFLTAGKWRWHTLLRGRVQ